MSGSRINADELLSLGDVGVLGAKHLLHAIRLQRAWSRTQGLALPPDVEQVERRLLASIEASSPVSNRHEPTIARERVRARPTVARMTATVPDAASALGVSPRTIERLIASGEITSTKVGRSRRIPLVELERLSGATTPTKERT